MTRGPELVVLQMAMAAYRQRFLDTLEEATDQIVFLVGDRHFASDSLGHRVFCADVDKEKVERLGSGEISIRRGRSGRTRHRGGWRRSTVLHHRCRERPRRAGARGARGRGDVPLRAHDDEQYQQRLPLPH